MAKVIKNNLGYLGIDFQYKLVKTFVEEPKFFSEIQSIVDQNMFTEPNLKVFVGVLKEYFQKNQSVPTYTMMSIKLREKARNDIDIDTYEDTIRLLKETTSEGYIEIRELAERFFKQQEMIRTANEILKIAGEGNLERYDDCYKMMTDVLNVGVEEDILFSPFEEENVEEALSPDSRISIPTGVEKIDDVLEGGLGLGELGVIIGPTSFGKALFEDELVATPQGYKKIKEIQVGDFVIGQDGKPTKVIGVFPQGEREIYEITFNDNLKIQCDKEHLWNVSTARQRKKGDYTYNTMTVGDMMNLDLMYSKKFNMEIPTCQPIEYEGKPVLFDPYLVGIMLGSTHHKISVVLKDYYDDNVTLNTKYIHEDYLYNSIDKRVALLNGILDDTAEINKSGKIVYTCYSKQLSLDIQELVHSLGGFATITEENNAFKLDIAIYNPDIKIFRNEEKQSKVNYEPKRKKSRSVVEIKSTNEIKNAVCIKVEAEDGLFLTRHCIVTHNTSMTTGMASFAATYRCAGNDYKGFKVLQIVFEDKKRQMTRKHIARISQIESKDLSKDEYIDQVREAVTNFQDKELLKNNLKILKWPSGEKSPSAIERRIRKCIDEGWKPDMVIVDYFECLCANRNGGFSSESEWKRESRIMRDLEKIADTYNIAFWVPVQGNRDSIAAQLVTMDKAGGALGKIQVAHIILSITRSEEDRRNNLAQVGVLKNRAGGLGDVMNFDFNNGTCTISSNNKISFDETLVYKDDED